MSNNVIQDSEKIFFDIKKDFDLLWGYKIRGKTLEIITPFSTLSGDFISIYLTQRDDRYIVSDGQWLAQKIQELELDLGKKNAAYIAETANHYSIKQTCHINNDKAFYFKSTTDLKLLTAYIYDVAHFIETTLNAIYASQVFFEEDVKQEKLFTTRVNNLFLRKIEENRNKQRIFELDRNNPLKAFRFNTILKKEGSSQLWLAMYITGSTTNYFCNSICRASTGFGYVRQKKELISSLYIAAIFDETAQGDNPKNSKIQAVKDYMENLHPTIYNYSDIEKIDDLSILYRECPLNSY